MTQTISHLADVFIQARMHRERREGNFPRLLIVHDMEAPETSTMAEDLGRNWFANPIADGKYVYASTQYGIDNNSIAGYVYEERAAYGAGGANDFGIHLEHAGYARQSSEEWLDDYSLAMLDRSAHLAAEIMDRYKIPFKWLDADDLRAGRVDGITTHAECSKAWGGNHTDPGPHFPKGQYMTRIMEWHNNPDRLPVLTVGDHDGKNSLGESDIPTNKGIGTVSFLQERLVAHGHALPKFGIDGDFGDETLSALREFTGTDTTIVTRKSWNALQVSPVVPEPEPPASTNEPLPEPPEDEIEPPDINLAPTWIDDALTIDQKLTDVRETLTELLTRLD